MCVGSCHVHLVCPEHKHLEDTYIIQFTASNQLKLWGLDGKEKWEWSLGNVKRVCYHKPTKQLEVEVGRYMYLWGLHVLHMCKCKSQAASF